MEFIRFKKDVEVAFNNMISDNLFVVNVDKDLLWTAYLLSFDDPDERQQHNCNACKSFIRHYGKVVAIDPLTYETKTFWDDVHSPGFEKAAQEMAKLVKQAAICNIFIQDVNEFLGCDHNVQLLTDGTTRTWHHLYVTIPERFKFNKRNLEFDTVDGYRGDVRARKEVLERSIKELTDESVETVIDLIEDNSLYRGAEFLKGLQEFLRIKKTAPTSNLSNYCWLNYKSQVAKIRNTAMGTLLINLSEGMDLERAVRAYESIMAPSNYKRPTALITKKQIEAAQKTVEELGLTDALPRRHAKVEDISVNDVLFVNRDTKAKMKGGMFESLISEATVNPKTFTKAEEVSVDKFLKDILPGSTDVSILVENKHIPNLVTLTAPENPDAGHLFKWNNNFAWVYNGSLADSFKEKVKAAGGNVDGFMRASLHWFNLDDLDLHVVQPAGGEIYFGNRHGISGGTLDVDMNVNRPVRDAVENVVWTDPNRLNVGTYTVYINNFNKRESVDVGFEVEIEINGELHKFNYNKMVDTVVKVANIIVAKDKTISIQPIIPEGSTSVKSTKEWNVDTMKFQKVSSIMFSPNHWEGNEVGNKHLFFMIEGCKNPDPVRGFFNEYLRSDLERNHRRVFEALASKAKTEYSDDQLSGLGFSLTQSNEVIIKVNNKPFKIKF
jgi:hypothetical protein|nr:MAG TPA: hypothetical protein [Bacteriophage sp.]